MRTNLKVPYEEKDDAKKLRCLCLPWAPCDACLDKVAEAGWGLPA